MAKLREFFRTKTKERELDRRKKLLLENRAKYQESVMINQILDHVEMDLEREVKV
jgi:hypothetical protein